MYDDPQRDCGVVSDATTAPLTQVSIWEVVLERWNSMQYQVLPAIETEPASEAGEPSGMMESSRQDFSAPNSCCGDHQVYAPLARFQSKTPNCPPMRRV